MPASSWIARLSPERPVSHRLVCFPHAGGGAQGFRSWTGILRTTEVWAVQLPGREHRFGEPPVSDLQTIVGAVAAELAAAVARPTVFFGHSMGGLVAFEVARELESRGRGPALLIVSAVAPPHDTSDRKTRSTLPHDELVAELDELGGTPPEVLADRELLELFLPMIRADFAAIERYEPVPGAAVDAPIVAFGGVDDPGVDEAQLSGWRQYTRARFEHRMFLGGHFYVTSDPAAVVTTIGQLIAERDPDPRVER